jgi:hypothetical protein
VSSTSTDYAHTPRAESNRQRKAHRLALAARSLGLQPYELTVVGGTVAHASNRTRVRRHARVDHDPSVETWQITIAQLIGLSGSMPGARQCVACGFYVLEVLTTSGRRLLIDPWPRTDGTVWPTETAKGQVARILAGHDERPDDVPLYRQHAVSCPASPSTARRQAPRCDVCSKPLDPVLAARDTSYTTHPLCEPREEVQPP